jgi:ABC-type branched-subunit amino acid transport system permease subunit
MAGRIKPITAVAVIFFLGSAVAPLFVASWATLFALILAKGVVVLGIMVLLQAGQVSFGHAMFFATAPTPRRSGASTSVAATSCSISLGAHNVDRVRPDRRPLRGALPGNLLRNAQSGFLDGAVVAAGEDVFLHQRRRRHPGRPSGIAGIFFHARNFQYVILYVSLLIAVTAFYGVQRYLDSPLGHMLRAMKSNETRLEYLGTSARRVLLVGYVISALLGGIGGALVAIIQQIATPEFGYWTKSGEFVFIAILGGGAHAFGAFAGAAMFECVRFYAAAHSPTPGSSFSASC